jgi:hypothetical protein
MKTVTVLSGSPVPTMSGVESVVVDPSAGSDHRSIRRHGVDGEFGLVVDSLPSGLVWTALAMCGPSINGW